MKPVIQQLHRKLYFIPLVLLTLDAFLSTCVLIAGTGLGALFPVFTAGILSGWISFLTGMAALFFMRKSGLAAGLSFIHGFINSIALLVLTAFWASSFHEYPKLYKPPAAVVLFKWLMMVLMMAGVYLGKMAAKKRTAT